ncbi:MAG: Txe/YoeB family addiction module toxin [Gammaproteobacteria bacterium]|nr:Txe/YoeB family addiction module toxin [Gammaproteobacteria bacterium]MBU1558696.1 Txe/YoeB family addiction module toxin [Gammaproteobacteria bacterium]MBU1926747.1 Txe/YoeB family addiction module toxin [Gammaproteobacteria bacterium]MBU2546457.1 Txe/YoeB family addiction module toxin [Gammaproteobacteria bacterium]
MILAWTEIAWEDYLYWQRTDKIILKKLNTLIKNTVRTPFSGLGKPEALKFDLINKWSRRITNEHRLVYELRDDVLVILQCRYHY